MAARRRRRAPVWLRRFSGDVLVAYDDHGRYEAGVGNKRRNRYGHELAVGTAEHARGRGLARHLVEQAAHRVIADRAVPIYVHDRDDLAAARLARAAGSPDRGWRWLGLSGD